MQEAFREKRGAAVCRKDSINRSSNLARLWPFQMGPVLIFSGKHIAQLNLQPVQDCFQFRERDVVFSPLYPVESCMGNANLLRKFRIRKAAACLSQVPGELAIEISFHPSKLANNS